MPLSCRWSALLLALLPGNAWAGPAQDPAVEQQIHVSVVVAEVDPTAFPLLGLNDTEDRPSAFSLISAAERRRLLSALQMLRESSLAKCLAQPEMLTLSGRPASIVTGGEQVVPVPEGLGGVGVQFEEFGVRLNLLPTVLGDGRIRLETDAEVSNLDTTYGTSIAGTVVPGRRTQRVHTTVEVSAGQTLAILSGVSTRKDAEPVQVWLITPDVVHTAARVAEPLRASKASLVLSLQEYVRRSDTEPEMFSFNGSQVHVGMRDGQDQLEIAAGGKCLASPSVTITDVSGGPLKLAVSGKRVQVEHPKFCAVADRLLCVETNRLTLDGNVKFSFATKGEAGEVTGKAAIVYLRDGHFVLELFE